MLLLRKDPYHSRDEIFLPAHVFVFPENFRLKLYFCNKPLKFHLTSIIDHSRVNTGGIRQCEADGRPVSLTTLSSQDDGCIWEASPSVPCRGCPASSQQLSFR